MNISKPKRQGKYLGMTTTEIGTLGVISLFGCCILTLGGALIFREYLPLARTTAIPSSAPSTLTATPVPLDTVTKTLPPTPTATPTPVPFAQIDLEPLLVQSSDFPGGITDSEVRPVTFERVPAADNSIYKYFQVNNSEGGFGLHVTVLLYESPSSKDLAYGIVVDSLGEGTQSITDVGEKATVGWKSVELIGEWVELAFIRCHAVVHVRMLFIVKVDDILLYSKKLDSRLVPVVCR